MPPKLTILVLIAGAVVSVVVSTNIKIVRQLNPDTNYPPFADSFSNRQCSSSTCSSRSTCAGGSCCMCKCLYDYPNVFVNRTSLKCMNYGELNGMSSANCQYSFRTSNEPLEVIPLTEEATGRIRFRRNSARVHCNENGLAVDEWHFLDVNGRWQNGEGNIFSLEYTTVVGPDGNKELTFLNWNAMLQPKYTGLIIKILMSCAGRKVGCILAKINGTYSTGPTPLTSPGPSAVTTRQTTSRKKPTQVPTLRSTTGPTVGSTQVHTLGPSLASTVKSGVPGDLETESALSTVMAPPESAEDQQLVRNGSSPVSKVIWPAVGAIAGMVCLISLVCLIMALYKRRKRRKRRASEKSATATEAADSDVKPANEKDPIYAEVPDKITDNPLYSQCTPAKEQISKRSKLDPLPALPEDEASCQLLLE